MSDGRTWGTVIGGIIGYFVPVVGWAAGAAIGGAVGGLLEPTKKVEQGRIEDMKVSVSQYGAGIPETWGNNVPPATWVWATDVIEIGQTQGGGKGGGGTEVTQYRQFIHGYLVLGRTPPVGSTIQIRKVWVDGKLNYDGSSGISPAQALASTENPFAQMSVHPGWEDQIPHPIMEFYEGIGNTPAYRGVVGVFVFGLECPGGRIPQLSFEICTNAGTQVVNSTLRTFTSTFLATVSCIDDPAAFTMLYGRGWDGFYVNYEVEVWRIGLDGTRAIQNRFTARNNRVPGRGHSDEPSFVTNGVSGDSLDYYNADGFSKAYSFPFTVNAEQTVYCKLGERAIFGWGTTFNNGPYLFDEDHGRRDMALGYVADVAMTDAYIYVLRNGSLDRYDIENLAYAGQVCTIPGGGSGDRMHVVNDEEIYVQKGGTSDVLRVIDGSLVDWFDAFSRSTVLGSVFNVRGNMLIETDGSSISPTRINISQRGMSPVEAPIDEVIESQCERVGLSGQIDVSTIDDTVWGYTFNKSPASARNNIAPLLTYAGVAQVEEDGIIRFFHRGDKTTVSAISYEELGCTEDGQEPGDPFPLTRTQEAECPRSVTVQYVNPFFDYQTSAETARRIVTDSELDETVTLDVAMTPDKAATIAHRTLYERWIARDTRSFKVSRKFAALSPGDVVTIEYPRGTIGNYMLAKVNDTGALIEAECVPADAELLTQNVPGTNGYSGQQISPLPSPTMLTIVDSRILRDADNNAGLYAAMAGLGSAWSGAELWAGEDANSLLSRGKVTSAAVQGMCFSVLGNYTLGNVDEHNLLTVDVGTGVLSSTTRDLLLNWTTNVAAVGAPGRWEIIKFQRVDDLGSGRYILSGLLRGLQGSEFAIGQHADGDRFVLLSDGGVLRPSFDTGTIGQDLAFKAVSIGRRFDSAGAQTSTNTGEGLRPASPTTPRKSYSGNDIVLTWRRRTRLSQQWWLGNVPLGEESQQYEIDIFADDTFTSLKRTLIATSQTVTYTSAQQIADFGSNQTTIHVRIYQMSGTVGRGHELQQSI
ncbi:phage tail protein [Xenophilus sp.]|uniref:phage tail protein n=1 Tax=Xenophilus sp. TaxID=1873499 RepID=UPI0037DD5C3F